NRVIVNGTTSIVPYGEWMGPPSNQIQTIAVEFTVTIKNLSDKTCSFNMVSTQGGKVVDQTSANYAGGKYTMQVKVPQGGDYQIKWYGADGKDPLSLNYQLLSEGGKLAQWWFMEEGMPTYLKLTGLTINDTIKADPLASPGPNAGKLLLAANK